MAGDADGGGQGAEQLAGDEELLGSGYRRLQTQGHLGNLGRLDTGRVKRTHLSVSEGDGLPMPLTSYNDSCRRSRAPRA